MSDTFTTTRHEGWFSRILSSIKGVLFGLLLLIGSIVLLFWNEGRAVKTAKGLKEAKEIMISVPSGNVDAINDGRLIHINGKVSSAEVLSDTLFGISEQVLKLFRSVEMYQWIEESREKKKKKIGGGEKTTTTYTYQKEWSETLHRSSKFKQPKGHSNPSSFPFQSESYSVEKANLESFQLNKSLIFGIYQKEDYSLEGLDSLPFLSAEVLGDSMIYYGTGSLEKPEVGDIKISFQVIPHGDFSIMAKQNGSQLEDYKSSFGTSLMAIYHGIMSAEEMITSEEQQNTIMTWLIRFFGYLFMIFGFSLILKPISVVGDVVPFIGNLLQSGLGVVSIVLATVISFIVIAIAWIFYRPLLGVTLIILAIGIFLFFNGRAKKKQA